jgi:uncharacterized membrane protein
LQSVDLLRGLLMLLMAIDHVRDYFTSVRGVDPTDPAHSWPALFAMRWITHLCAPGFIALAGTSIYLQRQRGKSAGQLQKLLVTRGLWLILLEVTVVSFGWSFCFAPAFQVIWAVGVSMIFLAALLRLATPVIALIGAAIVLLHNLLDPIRAGSGFDPGTGQFHSQAAATGWKFLHQQGLLYFHDNAVGMVLYPLIPWIGVICLGYAFGAVVLTEPLRRRQLTLLLAGVFLAAFSLLRIVHGYGDHHLFEVGSGPAQTAMSFLQVTKYPPSLQYLLVTLGVLLLLFRLFDAAATGGWLPWLREFIATYGRVPFFYYILHIYLLHSLALALSAQRGLDWHFWLLPGSVFFRHLDGWGYGIPTLYLIWALAVLALYLPCLWFSRLKARRRDWWLSYL